MRQNDNRRHASVDSLLKGGEEPRRIHCIGWILNVHGGAGVGLMVEETEDQNACIGVVSLEDGVGVSDVVVGRGVVNI